MDSLKRVALINSGNYGYGEFAIDGNTLLIGANGVGKTTALRAILYFYTANSQLLGIDHRKKTFAHFYFPYTNSYILYEYERSKRTTWALVYKQGSLRFRFFYLDRPLSIYESFFENGEALSLDRLFLKLATQSQPSKIITTQKEFRNAIYSERGRALFETKRFESFGKVLASIFINSKIEATSIKQLFIDAVSQEKEGEDLQALLRLLERFNTFYEDTALFERSKKMIQKTVELYEKIQERQEFFKRSLGMLLFQEQTALQKIPQLQGSLQEAQANLQELQNRLQKLKRTFEQKRDRLLREIGKIDGFLKSVEEKRGRYEGIEEKIEAFSQMDSLYLQKERLEANIEDLTRHLDRQKERFELRKSQINEHYTKLIAKLNEDILAIKLSHQKELQQLQKAQQEEIFQAKEGFFLQKEQIQKEIFQLRLQKEQKEQAVAHRATFTYRYETELQRDRENITKLQESIRLGDLEIKEIQKRIDEQKESLKKQKELLQEAFDKEQEPLQKRLEAIVGAIKNKNSLASAILKTKEISKYLYFIKEELLAKEFALSFKEDNNQIFALYFQDLEIPKESIDEQIETIKQRLQANATKYHQAIQKKEIEFQKAERSLIKRQRQLHQRIQQEQKELFLLQDRLRRFEMEKEEAAKSFAKEQEQRVKILREEIESLTLAIDRLQREQEGVQRSYENSIKAIKARYTKAKKHKKEAFQKEYKRLKSLLGEYEEQKVSELEAQERLFYESIGKEKEAILRELTSQLQALESNIQRVKSYEKEILYYKRDKEEYFDKEMAQRAQRRKLEAELQKLKKEFAKEESELLLAIDSTKEQIQNLSRQIERFKEELSDLEAFRTSPTYKKIDQKIEPIATKDSIKNLLKEIEFGYSEYMELLARLTKLIDQLPIFDNTLQIKRYSDVLRTAKEIKSYLQEGKIEEIKRWITRNFKQIVAYQKEILYSIEQFKQKIKPLIKRVSKEIQQVRIDVIELIDLRYQESDNPILDLFRRIIAEYEEHFGFEANLFGQGGDSKKIIDLLKELYDKLSFQQIDQFRYDESFILEFRVIENGNDTKFRPTLDGIGSNGTDILVKSLIYVTLIDLFKQKAAKERLNVHAILDEVGVLSQRYLKELIAYANSRGIWFVNGAPDEKLVTIYKRVYLIRNEGGNSSVTELIADA